MKLLKVIRKTEAEMAVLKGTYQLAIVIPKELSDRPSEKSKSKCGRDFGKIWIGREIIPASKNEIAQKEVRLYFDPATQMTFKNSVKNGIDKMISQIETQSIYKAFQEQIGKKRMRRFLRQKALSPLKKSFRPERQRRYYSKFGTTQCSCLGSFCDIFYNCSAFD